MKQYSQGVTVHRKWFSLIVIHVPVWHVCYSLFMFTDMKCEMRLTNGCAHVSIYLDNLKEDRIAWIAEQSTRHFVNSLRVLSRVITMLKRFEYQYTRSIKQEWLQYCHYCRSRLSTTNFWIRIHREFSFLLLIISVVNKCSYLSIGFVNMCLCVSLYLQFLCSHQEYSRRHLCM